MAANGGPDGHRQPRPVAVLPVDPRPLDLVRLDRKVRYELDGGDRSKLKSYNFEVEPGAVAICVPGASNGNGAS